MFQAVEVTADMKQRAYDYYVHHPSVSLRAIAAFLGVSSATFLRMRKAWGWTSRDDAMAQAKQVSEGMALADPPAEAAIAGGSSLRDAALSLVQVTRSRIEALMKEQRSARAMDHDKAARTLAAYAKTLTTAQALLEQESTTLDEAEPTDEHPRSIHELRDELARHLERIVAEEEAAGRDGLLV
ncbi:hypothetical protein [Microvirga alba]|uniref:Uncharacterized protein n=1 Tax=Microvirga alba TaxID=2791025 RepID=A0A931BLI3_9HYPH|nr:hypothetical protein [Microvirga alba]MBF9232048.1 hypothetical protein [Microvirga alba]